MSESKTVTPLGPPRKRAPTRKKKTTKGDPPSSDAPPTTGTLWDKVHMNRPRELFWASIETLLTDESSHSFFGPNRVTDLQAESLYRSMLDNGGERGCFVMECPGGVTEMTRSDMLNHCDSGVVAWQTLRALQEHREARGTTLEAGLSSTDYQTLMTYNLLTEYCILFITARPDGGAFTAVRKGSALPRDDYGNHSYILRHLYMCHACFPPDAHDQAPLLEFLSQPQIKRHAFLHGLQRCPTCLVVFHCPARDERHDQARAQHAAHCKSIQAVLQSEVQTAQRRSKKLGLPLPEEMKDPAFVARQTRGTMLQSLLNRIGMREEGEEEEKPAKEEQRSNAVAESGETAPLTLKDVQLRMGHEFARLHPTLKDQYIKWVMREQLGDMQAFQRIASLFDASAPRGGRGKRAKPTTTEPTPSESNVPMDIPDDTNTETN
jgi:hypothetical protein